MSLCAVVVTYNRERRLPLLLDRLAGQTRPPDAILVVDNASTDGTRALLASRYPQVAVVTLPENRGGGGGFEAGLRAAMDRGHAWAWLLDDDALPEPQALELLWEEARLLPPDRPGVFCSVQYDPDLDKYNAGFAWRGVPVAVPRATVDAGRPFATDLAPFCGFLVNRAAVERVGYPHGYFFMRFTDYEYSLRLSSAGIPVVVHPRSRMIHSLGERNSGGRVISRNPPWKAYYDARNRVYTAVRLRRRPRELWLTLRYVVRQSARELVLSPEYGWPNSLMRLRGVVDGLRGRMGKTVDPARSRHPDPVLERDAGQGAGPN